MFDVDCNCDECNDPCEHREELLVFKRDSGLTQKIFAGVVSKRLSDLAQELYVPDAIFIYFRGERVIVSEAQGAFQSEEALNNFIESMKVGWIHFQPEALLWYSEAWSSDSEAVLAGRILARDCPERYEVIVIHAYHVAARWRLHVEMKIEGDGDKREVISVEEFDVIDEIGLRIMGRLDSGRGSGLTH